jgi:hypothetical protein
MHNHTAADFGWGDQQFGVELPTDQRKPKSLGSLA